jgi:outer membrane protein TolC
VLTAQLASSYLALRGLDAEIEVLGQTLQAQRQLLDFVNARHELGNASGIDLEQQQALLSGTEAQLQALRDSRARFEHAIATLTGQPAPDFRLAADSHLPEPRSCRWARRPACWSAAPTSPAPSAPWPPPTPRSAWPPVPTTPA